MVKKKKGLYKNIWKRLNFKYRLSATNENTLEEIWRIRASIFSGAVLVITFAFLLITVTSVIIIATPIRYYLPGYLDSEIREQLIRASMRSDSIEQQMKYQDAYIENLKNVFAGTVQFDSVKELDTVSVSENDPLLMKSELEREFVKKYDEEEKYNLSVLSASSTSPTDGIIFFSPVKGVVSNKFNPVKQQFGVKINTSAKESVLAALEGTVIFTGYDFNDKHIIQIQHKNGFISVYKHNTMLLKKAGDKVKTGEAIALTEVEKDDKEQENYLYFELWFKGNAVNPEDYIVFN